MFFLTKLSDFLCPPHRIPPFELKMEATPGFQPGMPILQTGALADLATSPKNKKEKTPGSDPLLPAYVKKQNVRYVNVLITMRKPKVSKNNKLHSYDFNAIES